MLTFADSYIRCLRALVMRAVIKFGGAQRSTTYNSSLKFQCVGRARADRVTAEILGSQAYMRLKLEFNSSLIRWQRRAAVVERALRSRVSLTHSPRRPSFFSLSFCLSLSLV